MRTILKILATALLLGPSVAGAEDALPPEPGIEATIRAQIEAFLADDFTTAFTFASPAIQGMFGSAENFGLMVRQGYPMVWRPGDVEFLELHEEGGLLWQKVQVTDQAGGLHILDYQMIETPEGWKINGVYLLPAPGLSA